ncbi:DUF4294 domain-containing protein [Psychroflexus planctonicus]|uniref:DUF4294 domain-containing protein n=1 Tax=Psychroflexus planctonicus TaxID=1526575 RepID=A0ABQ1SFI6_9FLAO|nr:DUF4294 domain-containing protein [Psychroflexus planctonicus]GGE36880.1 hypothetical protein GCM10010832_16340 [Psychroflexus planctonicus]
MKKYSLYYSLFFLLGINFVSSQENDSIAKLEQKDSLNLEFYEFVNDSVFEDAEYLDEVLILPKLSFQNKEDLREYLILKRKTKRVWPYAVLAANRLDSLNVRLLKIDSKRKRKRYTKMIQNYIEGEFTDELKKLTKTEGQILVKLMHRQTGETTFDLVKELRTGWRAFWYNTTAKLFNISLKEKFNPYEVREDFLIEDILQREFSKRTLKDQQPAIHIDYYELTSVWKDKVHIFKQTPKASPQAN